MKITLLDPSNLSAQDRLRQAQEMENQLVRAGVRSGSAADVRPCPKCPKVWAIIDGGGNLEA